MIVNYKLRVEDKDKLEAFLKGSGATILATEVLSIKRPRFTQLDITSTYAEGIEQLKIAADKTDNLDPLHNFTKQDGHQIYRSLTFMENLLARVEDYNTLQNPDGSTRTKEERLRLFNRFLNSCTGITYKKESTRFKINPLEQRLIEIPEGFKEPFLQANYEAAAGEELDPSDGNYNTLLTKPQALEHPAWILAVGNTNDGRTLLNEYAKIVYTELSQRQNKPIEDIRAMGFWLRSDITQDQLRELFVHDLGNGSAAYGNNLLYYGASFLLLAQKSAPQAPAEKLLS